jgi:hypothetical protein
MSTKPNHRRGEDRRQDNGPHYERNRGGGPDSPGVARGRRRFRRQRERSARRAAKAGLLLEAVAMLALGLALIFSSGCIERPHDGPLWGDYCEPAPPELQDITFHACHWVGGFEYKLGVCQEMEPGVGACRPFCGPESTCEAGEPTRGPLGRCYCADREPSDAY